MPHEERSEIQILKHRISTSLNMPALGDCKAVSNNLSTAKRAVVVAMHKFVYGIKGS